ncbi:MAG: DUF4157 domain-containing protein [Bacteroidetes bacterium]|nr:MAG: DUF4157 domain-containing protein [Bacteroidota bacterium]
MHRKEAKNSPVQQHSTHSSAQAAPDQRQASKKLHQLQKISDASTIQRKASGGLPEQVKTGVETLSGVPMHDVNVYYNSPKPAQLQAHAYAQGNNIHLAPGQEKHLPHEAWHVVQQKQGRVKATGHINGSTPLNDSPSLEKEADQMGAKAMQVKA